MEELWIHEEGMNEKFLDKLDHHVRIDGEVKSTYFISEGTEGDYVDHNLKFLQDF